MKSILLLLTLLSLINADGTYDKALKYLNGKVGGKEVVKKAPRCPYEKCTDGKTYKFVEKDTKTGYSLLKKAHEESDFRASFKAMNILLKQLDYKKEKCDDYLLKRLKDRYGINEEQYNQDIVSFMQMLVTSSNKTYRCKGAYNLYTAIVNNYFDLYSDSLKETKLIIYQDLILNNCSNTSYEYFTIHNNKKKGKK